MSKFAKKLKKEKKIMADEDLNKENLSATQTTPEGIKPVPSIKVNASQFIIDLASIMYYGSGQAKLNTPFEMLDETGQATWVRGASLAMVSLDKMDKMVVKKVEPEDTENNRNKNLARLKSIIDSFNKRLKTAKPELYPSGELAFLILEGKLPEEIKS